MKDLFSLKGRRKDHIIRYFNKKMYQLIEKGDWIIFTIKKWYTTITISCLIYNDLVTLVIVKAKVTPFYERYTVL